jgi:hypothetical protein
MRPPHEPAVKAALREAAQYFSTEPHNLRVTELAHVKRQRTQQRFYRVRVENAVGTTRFYLVSLDGTQVERAY